MFLESKQRYSKTYYVTKYLGYAKKEDEIHEIFIFLIKQNI